MSSIIKRLGKTGQVLCFEQLGVLHLLKLEDREEIASFVARELGLLLEYDGRHGGYLVETLRAYVEQNGNLRATAKALQVHINTLLHRLERIQDVSGHDLHDYETRLSLSLALKIVQLLG
ncbi:MAG: helix-turn-helix domain-containing protein [Dehalococcoidia bacterium]|nr:helix-turn-helix domain-containing protein [Dehalococcoidia bacterium]